MNPASEHAALINSIVSELEKIIPHTGPKFGSVSVTLTFHDGSLVRIESGISVTRKTEGRA